MVFFGTDPRLRTRLAALAIALVLPLGAVTAQAGDEGTLAHGGKLYDKWYKVTKAPKPEGNHPAWPTSNTKKKGDVTHRCKSCHGWDYMGKDGAYASGSYKTGVPGVRAQDGGDAAAVLAVLKGPSHGYAGKMSDADLQALAMFVTKGQVNMDSYIDRASKKPKGDAAKGADYYATMCANCHGADGKEPEDMPPLGKLTNKNPWEIMHKVLNGQPAEKMPALRALPMQVTVDILAHLQTLPSK